MKCPNIKKYPSLLLNEKVVNKCDYSKIVKISENQLQKL